jgi:hypothetical protein
MVGEDGDRPPTQHFIKKYFMKHQIFLQGHKNQPYAEKIFFCLFLFEGKVHLQIKSHKEVIKQ